MQNALKLPRLALALVSILSGLAGSALGQAGAPGYALNLEGTTSYVQAPNAVWFSNNFTVEAWVFVRSFNNWSRLIDFANGPDNDNVYLALSFGGSGQPIMGIFTNTGNPTLLSPTALPLNQWTHLAATLNGTTGTIYINGNPVVSGTLNVPPNVVRTNNYIGRSNYAADSNANAIFDEVRIWNVARTQTQIQNSMRRTLPGNPAGLVGYWRFDEGSGPVTADVSAHSAPATLMGLAGWTNSTAPLVSGAGSALSFNGTTQAVSISNTAALNPYPMTVMTWFKAPVASTHGALVNKYQSSSDNGYQIFLSGGHLLGWYFRDGSDNVFNGSPMDAGAVNDGLWHHAAMAIDASGGRLYLDGVLKTNLAWTGTAGATTTTLPVSLGIYQGDSFFSGFLDEVSIWNTALTTAQIQQRMSSTLVGNEANLVAYYPFDEGSGTNTVDVSGNGHGATLSGGIPWVASGAGVTTPWFNPISAIGSGTDTGAAIWGDFNGDGRLDLLLTGNVVTDGPEIWTNSGGPVFTQYSPTGMASLGNVIYSAAQWGDFDNDGRLDLLLTGAANGNPTFPVPDVWHNQTNGQYGNVSPAGLQDVLQGSVAWGDFDNDGKLDFVIAGAAPGSSFPTTQVWRNLGTNGFAKIADLTGVGTCSVAVADFNRDGLLDIVICGQSFTGAVTQIWLNNGNNTFTQNTNAVLPGFLNASVAVADFNNDGYPDLVLTGLSGTTPTSQVWLNLGNNTFSNLNVPLTGIFDGAVACGDFDNDGFPDIVLTGGSVYNSGNPASPVGQLWHNNGNNTFTQMNSGLQGVYDSAVNWGDYNNDGKLDLLVSGAVTPGTYTTFVYQDNAAVANTPPTTPTAPAAAVGTNNAQFSWNAATDLQTPAGSLTYNVRVGTSPGGIDVVSPEANPANGYRVLPQPGNARQQLSYKLNNLTFGATYYWSVQAVDSAFAGSAFASEGRFIVGAASVVTGPASQLAYFSATISGSVLPNGHDSTASFQYGTNTSYGSTTPVVSILGTNLTAVGVTNALTGLSPGVVYHYRLMATNSIGTNFGADLTFTTPPVTPPGATTLAATGLPLTPTLNGLALPDGATTTAWFQWGTTTNYGSNTPVTVVNATNFSPVAVSNVLIGLTPGVVYHFQLVASNLAGVSLGGDQTLSFPAYANLAAGVPPVSASSVAWGDFNNDGLMDLLVTGQTEGSATFGVTQLWQNLGNGAFSNVNSGLPPVSSGSVAWGDFDNDGRLDVLLTGDDTSGNRFSQVWHNNGDGTFSLDGAAALPGVDESSVALADFDNDGYLDILLTGSSATGPISQIWRNNHDGSFSDLNAGLAGVQQGSVAVIDFDKDGFMDVLLTGTDSHGGRLTQLWHNNGNGAFTLNTSAGLPGIELGSAAVADFDNDGWPDILLSGAASGSIITEVLHNNHDGTFLALTNGGLPGVYYSSVAIGDLDNDGLPDILLTGTPDGNAGDAICQVWRNLGNGTFTNVPAGLSGAWFGSIALGDLNNDGRLDFLVTGFDTNFNPQASLWQNAAAQTNTAPAVPVGLNTVPSASGVTLAWNPATDAQTPSTGLSYNIRVGTNSGGSQVLVPQSTAGGVRLLPQTGNAQQRLNLKLASLVVGTKYYWSVQSVDGAFAGSPFAAENSFTVGQPGVITGAPVQVTSTSEQLNGSVSPNGFDSTAWFQWGTTTNYGSNTTTVIVSGTNSSPVAESNLLSGLTMGVVYHYRLVASNQFGLSQGLDASFTTPTPPTVVTLPPNGVVPTSATFNGTVKPNAATTTAAFQWGTTTNYGNDLPFFTLSATNTLAVALSNQIIGLTPATTYHFRLSATNLAGISNGLDQAFATPAPTTPTAVTVTANAISPNRATLTGTALPNGAATAAWFQWGTSAGYGSNTTTTPVNATNLTAAGITNSLSNLVANTQYFYRLVATNSAGSNFGAGLTFTTLPATSPSVTTLAVTGLGSTGATLNGSVNPNGADSTSWFQWGTNVAYGNNTTTVVISSNNPSAVTFTNALAGLTTGLTYHYRAVSSNRFGLVNGADLSFQPPLFASTGAAFPGLLDSAAAWGDFNNDGRLDLLLAGTDNTNFISLLSQNLGGGAFSNLSNPALAGVALGSVKWADYDNDGNLDFILFGGTASTFVTQLWHNNGDGTFTQNTNNAFPPLAYCSVAWGDYDNDGRPDLLLTGADSNFLPLTQLWHNDGHGFFSLDTNAGLTPVFASSVAWGDYDKDGRLDILLCGADGNSTPQTQLWHNDGSGYFSQDFNAPLPGVYFGSVAWGDYDNDGLPDILVTGMGVSGALAQVWHNDTSGFFSQDVNVSLPGIYVGSGVWGDYDNDGKSDILLTGLSGTNPVTQLWRNTGGGTFSQVNLSVPGVCYGSAVFGDYDTNGRLDIFLTGATAVDQNGNPLSPVSQVLANFTPASNTPPAAPSGLTLTNQGLDGVLLKWKAAVDTQTPSNGLSYNVRVGTTPGGVDVLAPNANIATGLRRLPETGNAQQDLSFPLANLPPGTYYWSVQAIDTSFAGSPFAAESSFSIVVPPAPVITSVQMLPNTVLNIQFTGVAGVTYTLQASPDLSNWDDLQISISPTNFAVFQLQDTNAAFFQKRYYRLRAH